MKTHLFKFYYTLIEGKETKTQKRVEKIYSENASHKSALEHSG